MLEFIPAAYTGHILYAKQLSLNGTVPISHYLFEQLLVIIRAILPFNIFLMFKGGLSTWVLNNTYQISAWIISILSYAFLTVLLYKKIVIHLQRGALFVSLGLMLVSAISIFNFNLHHLFFGFIVFNFYANPTLILGKLLGLLLFVAVASKAFTLDVKGKDILIITVLSILTTLVKPNFALCFLPGVIMWVAFLGIKKNPVNMKLILLGFILPMVLVLGYQYIFSMTQRFGEGFSLSPFMAIYHYVPSMRKIGLYFLASILFPLLVFFSHIKKAIKEKSLLLAWSVFFFGCILAYFFIENGEFANDLKFFWMCAVWFVSIVRGICIFYIPKPTSHPTFKN